jgi:chromosome segregation ATPase
MYPHRPPPKAATAGRTALLALALACGASLPLHAQPPPPAQVDAYVLAVKAEQAERAGQLDEALALRQRSLTLYRTLAEQHPDWRPDLVQARVAETLSQIETLRQRLIEEPGLPADAPRSLDAWQARWETAEAAWREEKEILEVLVEELETERTEQIALLSTAQAAAEQAADDRENLQTSLTQNTTRLQRMTGLQRELQAALDAQIAEANTLRATLAALAEQQAALTNELAAWEATGYTPRRVKNLEKKAETLASSLRDAERDRTAAEQARDEALAQATTLGEQVTPLVQEQERLTTALAAAEGSLAALGNAPERLAALETELATCTSDLQTTREAATLAREQADTLAADLNTLREHTTTVEAARDQLAAELQTVTQERDVAQAALAATADAAALAAETERLRNELATITEQRDAALNQGTAAQTALNEATASHDRTAQAAATAQRKLEEKVEALSRTIDQNRGEMDQVRTYKSTIKARDKALKLAERDLNELRTALQKITNNPELLQLRSENAALREQMEVLKASTPPPKTP